MDAIPQSTRIFADLSVPVTDETLAAVEGVAPEDLWRFGDRVIGASVAGRVWREWHPGDDRCAHEPFSRAFTRLLADAYSLGLRLDRFREMSSRLPEPVDKRGWIDAFEAQLAGDDFGTIRLTVSHEQFSVLQASNRRTDGGPTWDGLIERVSDEIFDELGLIYAPPLVETDRSLEAPWLRCAWNDLTMPPTRGLRGPEVFVEETVYRLGLLDIQGQEAVHPVTGLPAAIIDASLLEVARRSGIASFDRLEFLGLCLSGTIRRAAGALVNRRLYDLYSQRLGEFTPELMKCVEGRFSPAFVVQVLRALVAEGIGVRNLSEVFRAMLEPRAGIYIDSSRYIVFNPPTGGVAVSFGVEDMAEMTPQNYADFVRTALRRQIAQMYAESLTTLIVYLLDPESEKRFARGMSEREQRAFIEALKTELPEPTWSKVSTPVVLTSAEIRRKVWRLTFPELPHVAIVAYQELPPEINIQPIARIIPQY